ncbi:MAG: TrmH family RNA methyltransferase, partial [Nocardioides sp.]
MPALAASNARVKEARKLSRRSVRTERRLFLADGPKAVEGALGAALDGGTGWAVEVFATAAATEQYDELRALSAGQDVPWTTVED